MKKIATYLILVVFCGCQNISNTLPNAKFKYLGKYHCWPYNVKVYSVNKVLIDSLFYTYPLKSYYRINTKYNTSPWAKYESSEIDTTIWYGMDKTLEQCDDNIELSNQVLKGGEIYYSGIYQYFKNKNGEQRRRYETILFLDVNNNKMHVFKDINKVY
jgi:hypothetical protein